MYHKILNRRSQKNRCGYLEYYEKIEKQIVKPKIYVDIVKMSYEMWRRFIQRAVCVSSASTVLSNAVNLRKLILKST